MVVCVDHKSDEPGEGVHCFFSDPGTDVASPVDLVVVHAPVEGLQDPVKMIMLNVF